MPDTEPTELTLFDLPNSPEQIGIQLPTAKLRRIDFSALDFSTARRATFEYIKTYFPDEFNDFVASNGVVMWSEIQASNVAKLSLRGDVLANEGFLPTSRTEEAVSNHLALINQQIRRQTPAVVDIEATVQTALTTDVVIPPGLVFSTRGPDGDQIDYELYKAPGDFTSNIVIQAGKRGVIGYGIEGRFAADVTTTSPGGPNQSFTISAENVLDDPITVFIDTGEEIQEWDVTTEPLERFGPTDQVVNVNLLSDRVDFRFGDNVNGKSPLAGQVITFRYRTGGGIRGRIGADAINDSQSISPLPPATSPVQVQFRNPAPSSGGTDRESLDQAKKRAPRDFVVRAFAADRPASIVTEGDYAQVASTFAHPVYGSVAKAVATIRTGLNANLVEVFALANGPDTLVVPSAGLKIALETFFSEFNVLTDTVRVLDGALRVVDTDMTVVISRNADASFVKERVTAALDQFFDTTNREMGQALYVSDIVEVVTAIDGVAYLDLFEPRDNILPTKELAMTDTSGVGINEIIIEGTRDIKFYYEKSQV
jgi:hypothetical protein